MTFKETIKSFSLSFWVANTMELFERWAYFGLFLVLPVYLTDSTDTGALGFSQSEKGIIMGSVGLWVYLLPIITGAIADKIGYKKILIIAFVILSSGYFLMGFVTGFYPFLFLFLYAALGAALFKPIISATVARTTNSKTASIGFGVFYMMVNFGALVGPILASKLRETNWNYVFYMVSGIILINMILVIFFYKEPVSESNKEPLLVTIKSSLTNIFIELKNPKLSILIFLLIGFWAMYWQLFYTLPVFVMQWMDTSVLYDSIHLISPWFAEKIGTETGIILPEMLLNIDALFIIIFQIFISTIVMKYKPLNSMIVGIIISSIGIGLTLITSSAIFLIFAVFIFSIGEMVSSPKITEYLGRIAPKDKVALYMGCAYLPVAFGSLIAGYLSGDVYTKMSDKITLLQTEIAQRGMQIPEISNTFTQNDYINKACELTGMNNTELTSFLWDNYEPSNIWIIFTSIGIISATGLFFYDKFLLKSKVSD